MNDQVLLDLTSLVEQPYRTGIQRVEREVLRHWPDRMQLVPCVIDPSGLIWQLPPDITAILCPAADQPRRSFAEDQSSLAALRREATPLPGSARRHILNLELFYEPWRAKAYSRMCKAGWRVQWLVYDFIPWLSPNLFAAGATQHCMHYLRALREVPEVAFISAQTRDEYYHRVMRQASMAGPVLPLGADGLGLERQTWSRDRRAIVVIGSVERRKNPHLVGEAFRRLWAQGIAAPLIFAGRINQEQESLVRDLAGEARDGLFRIVDHPTDDEMRDLLRGARAVLNASEVEGFGLAPYEALHCGIPVVTPGTLPSLSAMPGAGQIRLRDVNAETLADAVRRVMDDETAERLWRDAVGLELPTWREFAHDVAAWTETTALNGPSGKTTNGVSDEKQPITLSSSPAAGPRAAHSDANRLGVQSGSQRPKGSGERSADGCGQTEKKELLTMQSRPVGSLREFDDLFAECAAMETELERIEVLSHCHLADPDIIRMPNDPFSPEYDAAVLKVWSKLSGRESYDAATCEKIPVDIQATIRRPSIYLNNGEFLGDYLEACGQIIKRMGVDRNTRILEYGCGDGQISLHLARLGCDVTVVDIEDAYLQIVRGQAERMDVSIKAVHGDFMTGTDLGTFDRIFFFQAFHHSLTHQRALQQMGRMLNAGGSVFFIAEPIIDPTGYWSSAIPYPWGPRLDGLSLRAMRTHGWMELGFQETYFLDMLARFGWSVEKWASPTNGLATGFVARQGS